MFGERLDIGFKPFSLFLTHSMILFFLLEKVISAFKSNLIIRLGYVVVRRAYFYPSKLRVGKIIEPANLKLFVVNAPTWNYN